MKQGLFLMMMCTLYACGDVDPGTARSGTGGTGEVTLPLQCNAVQEWDPEWVAFEEEMLRLINEHRTNGSNCGDPTHPLQSQSALQCAARLHSWDMNDRDYYQHTNPDGDGPRERMEAAGYNGGTWGENIFKGPTSAQEAMDGFMDSPGHCSNIMSPEFSLVGIGVHGTSWTQNFSD